MSQQKLVGGQTFPRRKHPERHTVVPTLSFPEERTKLMLKRCKEKGVCGEAASTGLGRVGTRSGMWRAEK